MLDHLGRREHWHGQPEGDPESAPKVGDHVAVIVRCCACVLMMRVVCHGSQSVGRFFMLIVSTQLNSVGKTKRVSSVDVTKPPMTTVASGRCTSAPAPVETAIGMNPTLATSAVIRTGRSRMVAP